MKPIKWAAKSVIEAATAIVKKIPDFASKVCKFLKSVPSKLPTWLFDNKTVRFVKKECYAFAEYINRLFKKCNEEISKHFIRSEVTKNLKDYVLKNHCLKKVLQEVKYVPIERLARKSFFNPKWIKEQVLDATKYAYNYAINSGKKRHIALKYKGKIINVFVKSSGEVDTVYGTYKYTAKQLMKMAGRK